MLFRLPIVKFFNRILNRITVTVVLVALQLAWLTWVFFALTTGAARVWVTGVLNGLSLLIILYLVRKDENSAYKVGWIALIGLLPLLGGALYLAFVLWLLGLWQVLHLHWRCAWQGANVVSWQTLTTPSRSCRW